MYFVVKVLIVPVVFVIVYKLIKLCEYLKKVRNIPMLVSGWDFVNFLKDSIFKGPYAAFDSMEQILMSATETKKMFIGTKLIICAVSPEDIYTITTSNQCIDKSDAYRILPGKTSLLVSKAEMWKPHRRLLNPTLNLDMTKSFFNIFNDVANEFIIDLDVYSKNQTICNMIDHTMFRVTDATLRTNFGTLGKTEDIQQLIDNVHDIMVRCDRETIRFYTRQFGLYQLQALFNRSGNPVIEAKFNNILDIMYRIFPKNCSNTSRESEKRENVLDRLKSMHRNGILSDEQLNDQMVVFVVAALDTTANALANVLLCLAMHPEIQEKAYQEIDLILGKNFDKVEIENVHNLKYLDRIIKESLRITPVATLSIRTNSVDIKLQKGIIPRGSDLLVPISAIHKNKHIWGEHTNKFNPDNFLPENFEAKHNCSYIPFGYGPRGCIGYKYAYYFMRVVTAKLLGAYKFTTKLELKNLKYQYGIISPLEGGHLVSIEKRIK